MMRSFLTCYEPRGDRTILRPVVVPNEPSQWLSRKPIYALARQTPRDFGQMEIARSHPLSARVVLHAKPPQGRKYRNQQGLPARSSDSRNHAQR